MIKLNKKIYIFLASILFSVIAPPTRALELQYPTIPGFGDLNTLYNSGALGIGQLVQFVLAFSLWIAGLMAFGALIIAGFMYATSQGAPWKQMNAKNRIWDVMIGVVILLGVYIVLGLLNPQLLTLGGQYFRICGAPDGRGGTIQCKNPDFPDILGGGSEIDPTLSLTSGVCMLDTTPINLGTPFDITKDCPAQIIPPGDADLTNNPRIVPGSSGPLNWDGKVYFAIITGTTTKATFYQYRDYNAGQDDKGWIEIIKDGANYSCRRKPNTGQDIHDCKNDLGSDPRNKGGLLYVNFKNICIESSCGSFGDRWEDDISSIKVSLLGGGAVINPPQPLTYTISHTDSSVAVDLARAKNILDTMGFTDNRVEELGQRVIDAAIANSINPAFAFSIWAEESGASSPGVDAASGFGCFPGGVLSTVPFQQSLDCFINFTHNEHPNDFAEWVRWFCGPNQNFICANNPNFIKNFGATYDRFVPLGTNGAKIPLNPPVTR
ncbi:MAG: hypothetical protein HYV65_01755 [Candidatus Spechtbacteria bacterium]|nr:hypothetical protein [Candidatus Spechtbacteria bacterium]